MVTATENDVSISPVKAYMLSYFRALATLKSTAADFYEKAQDQSLSESEQATYAAAYLDASNKIAHLKDVHNLIVQKYAGGVNPPGQDLIDKSRRLSAELASKIAANNTAVAILKIITSFVDGWTGLVNAQPGGGPAGAGATPAAPVLEDMAVSRMVRATNLEFLGTGLS